MKTIKRFFKKPDHSFFLFGPRGTGKSTWVKQIFPNALYIDMLSDESYRLYTARPDRLLEVAGANPQKKVIVIDEIQKVPALLSIVHLLIEQEKKRQFILTGSSARKIKRAEVDLLGGRALLCSLHPFMAAELGNYFSLENALKIGMVPIVVAASDHRKVLQSYISLYIREEVQMEGLVRNIGNFSRFLEAASFSHASMLNISTIARECHVERKVVEGYIAILEDLLLAWRVPIFSKRAKRAVTAHPKFFFFDTGVFRSIRPKGPLDRPAEIDGAALEGLVAQHLRAWLNYRNTDDNLYFWRTKGGSEVDLIVYGESAFAAFEIKNSIRVREEDLKGLRVFKKDFPESRCILLYRGKERLLMHNILCFPCESFLRNLKPDFSIDESFEIA